MWDSMTDVGRVGKKKVKGRTNTTGACIDTCLAPFVLSPMSIPVQSRDQTHCTVKSWSVISNRLCNGQQGTSYPVSTALTCFFPALPSITSDWQGDQFSQKARPNASKVWSRKWKEIQIPFSLTAATSKLCLILLASRTSVHKKVTNKR